MSEEHTTEESPDESGQRFLAVLLVLAVLFVVVVGGIGYVLST